MFFLKHCISDISWTKSELLKALNEFTDDENIAEKFQSFLSKSIHVESLIIGNIEKERAFDFAISFLSNIGSSEPLNNTLVHCKRNLLVPVNSHAVLKLQNFDSSNPNSALHYFIQVGCPKDLKLRNKLLLLSVMMHEPSFDQLRTKEQLGYIVSSGVMYSYSSMGLYIIIQSERDCEFLEKRLECFLESYFSILKSMSKTVFDHFLEATINLVSKKDENLGKEFFRNCSYIKLGHYEFDRPVKSVELLKTLNLEDMIDFYERNILPHVSTCLIIKMMSANGEEGEYKESDDINKLRSTFTLSEEARPSLSEYSRFLEISLSKI
jgi:insulysin